MVVQCKRIQICGSQILFFIILSSRSYCFPSAYDIVCTCTEKVNFSDWTKQELISLIENEGLEVPGDMVWDSESGSMKRQLCKKSVYVNFVKTSFFGSEPQQLVRVGKRLRVREVYCIVDLFMGAHGAVRILYPLADYLIC